MAENGFGSPDNAADGAGEESNTESFSLFIGGLSYGTEQKTLEQFFEDNKIKILSCRIMQRDNRSRGFGYADFDSKEEADKCYALEDTSLEGRTLRFDTAGQPGGARGGRGGGARGGSRGFSNDRRGGRGGRFGNRDNNRDRDNESPTKLLLLKNLSYSTNEDTLYNTFDGAKEVRILKHRNSDDSRGLAFIEYGSVDDATCAREKMNGSDIDGRNVNIVFAVPREDFQGRGEGRGGF